MPHYAAAAMFARKREDLVPGLSLLFDERWALKLAEKTDTSFRGKAAKSFRIPGPSIEASRKELRRSKSAINMNRLVTAFSITSTDDVRFDDLATLESSRIDPFSQAAAATPRYSYNFGSMSRRNSFQDNGDSPRNSSSSQNVSRSLSRDQSMNMHSKRAPSVGSLVSVDSLSTLPELEPIESAREGAETPKFHALKPEKKEAESDASLPLSQVGRQLRERSWLTKCTTRILLGLLALVLFLPEPLQDMFVEEFLTLGVAFFFLADLGFAFSTVALEIALQALILLLLIVIVLGLLLLVHRSSIRSIKRVQKMTSQA